MNKKTVSISLPKIEGIELKGATVKKGDFLTCLSDPSKTVVFGAKAWSFDGCSTFTILYNLPMLINGKVARTPLGAKFPFSNFRYSTEEEKALMIKEMEKWGKRYNPETRSIEDIEKGISSIKTFKDLKFKRHPTLLDATLQGVKEMFAEMEFENGYGVSVIFGERFYSNGIDTYEVGILKDGNLCYDTYITDDVLGYQDEEEVTEIMRKVQELNN